MNEKINLRDVILEKVFPKDIDTTNFRVEIKCLKPLVTVSVFDANKNILFCGNSKCSPNDTWDDFIGITLAIARLKMSVNSYFKKHKDGSCNSRKPFIPKKGESYWTYFLGSDVYGNNIEIMCEKYVWTNSETDYFRLGRGNVFATERHARKEGRRKYFEGRIIAKEARKNGYA